MLAGFLLLFGTVAVVIVISNSGRISSSAGKKIGENQALNNKRSACITDLRNTSDNYAAQVADAVLNRLTVLDGVDPSTGDPIPQIETEDGDTITNPVIQKSLALKYVKEGLVAQAARIEAAEKLTQPTLNETCGEPIVDKTLDRVN